MTEGVRLCDIFPIDWDIIEKEFNERIEEGIRELKAEGKLKGSEQKDERKRKKVLCKYDG